jgi:hypothetical protein
MSQGQECCWIPNIKNNRRIINMDTNHEETQAQPIPWRTVFLQKVSATVK